MRWRAFLFVGVMALSPMARASTELHVGGAGFWNALGIGDPAGEARNDLAASALPNSTDPLATEDAATDAWAFAVDKALLGDGGASAPDASKHDRFKWVFLLIAFAGLTALFTGRRTGGRGLISA